MRTRLPNTAQDWGKMLTRVYEKQGPSDFAKYQYSISSILRHLKRNGTSIGKILEYCKNIQNPKDVLVDSIFEIMLDDDIETTIRVAAGNTLRVLIPKIWNYPALNVTDIQEVLASTGEEALQETFNNIIQAINSKTQEHSGAYAVGS